MLQSTFKSLRAPAAAALAVAALLVVLVVSPQPASAAICSTTVYNGTVVGSDWGMDCHLKTARIAGGKLVLGKGTYNTRLGSYAPKSVRKSKSFALSPKCGFYKNYDCSYETGAPKARFSGKVSKAKMTSLLKKASRNIGTGKYDPNHYYIAFKVKHGKVVKIGLRWEG